MSECVLRMEMLENCETCRLRVNDSPTNVPNWICAINQWPTFYCKKSQNHANEDKYLHDCPIICQLPEGHGRLVDVDEDVSKYITIWDCNCSEFGKQTVMAVDDMQYLPTIVPAERIEE